MESMHSHVIVFLDLLEMTVASTSTIVHHNLASMRESVKMASILLLVNVPMDLKAHNAKLTEMTALAIHA